LNRIDRTPEFPLLQDRVVPKPVVAVVLILSETVVLSTLAENNFCVKVKPRWRCGRDQLEAAPTSGKPA